MRSNPSYPILCPEPKLGDEIWCKRPLFANDVYCGDEIIIGKVTARLQGVLSDRVMIVRPSGKSECINPNAVRECRRKLRHNEPFYNRPQYWWQKD